MLYYAFHDMLIKLTAKIFTKYFISFKYFLDENICTALDTSIQVPVQSQYYKML